MSTVSASVPQETDFPAPVNLLVRFSVDQYHEMIHKGILAEDQSVELLDGWLTEKMPKNPQHRVATRLTREALERILPADWYVDSQEPITLANSEPEPDVVVVRGYTRHYLDRHPGPDNVGLVVEVADASLEHDQTLKLRLYAEAGIAVYWIVNLVESHVEVYADPSAGGYRQRIIHGKGDSLVMTLGGVEIGAIPVVDILP
jgi:Uma2 family endonuclease